MELEKIILRLSTLGYEYKETDEMAVEFCIEKVERHILNETNQDAIPEGLLSIAIDMVCGEFLRLATGMGTIETKTFERVAKTISEGDTSISFADGDTPEKRFYDSIDYLLRGYETDFIKYRKLVW